MSIVWNMNNSEKLNEIINACKRGSNEAFSQLVDMYSSRCYGYFYRLSGNTADSNDLLGELFLKLVEKIRSFKGGSFEKWLFTVASNIFHDFLRQKYQRKKLLDRKAELLSTDSPSHGPDDELLDRLGEKLAKLGPDTAELLMLRFYGDLSFKQLAAMRSEPIGTTLSKVHRGLKKLRELMREKNE